MEGEVVKEIGDSDLAEVHEIVPDDNDFPLRKGDGTITGAFIGASLWIGLQMILPD